MEIIAHNAARDRPRQPAPATGPRTPATPLRAPATGPRTPATGPRTPATGPRTPATGPRTPAAGLREALGGPSDRVELDILCLDGRLVVAHDPREARLPGRLAVDDALAIVAASGQGLLADIKGRGAAELLGHALVAAGLAGRTIVCGELGAVELACRISGATRAWTLPAPRLAPPARALASPRAVGPAPALTPAQQALALAPAHRPAQQAPAPAPARPPAQQALALAPAHRPAQQAPAPAPARPPAQQGRAPAPAHPPARALPPTRGPADGPPPPAHAGPFGWAGRRAVERVERAAVSALGSGRCDVVCVDRRFVSAGLVQAVHAHAGRLLAWTVDDPSDARRLAELGVDGVITNEPDKLAASVAGRSAQWSDG